MAPKSSAAPPPRRRGRKSASSIPGLENEVGEPAIARELEAAAKKEAAEKQPEPAPPAAPPDLFQSLSGELPPSPLKTPIQALFAMCGGLEQAASTKKASPEALWKLPDWEANLYGRCAEISLARRQLTLERYAEWVLLIGLGGRVLFNLWLLKKWKATAPAAAPRPAPPPAPAAAPPPAAA